MFQVRHMMSVIEPQFQRDFISLLPKELALYVLSFLKPRDLLNAAQTCSYWRILAEDNLLWREKCREAGMSEAVCNSGAAAAAKRKKSSNFLYSAWKVSSQIRLQIMFFSGLNVDPKNEQFGWRKRVDATLSASLSYTAFLAAWFHAGAPN